MLTKNSIIPFKKINKLLIANRGEIACRIARTAKKMGIKTVVIYSEADMNSLHVRAGDEAVFVGEAPANMSYLAQNKILDAIKISGADAVHPGYGFLSENAKFVKLLEQNSINFVGPHSEAIAKMGDKIEAKKIAESAGVNVVPGHIAAIQNIDECEKIARKLGYPVMLKAAAGGGGRGIRIVRNREELQNAFSTTRSEALSSFADERVFIEKYIENPRHIEVQVLADKHGNYLCLGDRDCTIQRHHQKIIEEAPSSFLNEKTKKKMQKQAIALAKKVKYFSAGTVEFIVDGEGNFYFMEMNTRLQVEHPVTELITGLDLVELMLRVAQGEKLTLKQEDIVLQGHAMECRIYAEDPACGFLPSTGRINLYSEPPASPGLRIDSGIYEGGEVSMFYDAMISKVCVHSSDRLETIRRMREYLNQYLIEGVSHNISFLQTVLNLPPFIADKISTHFIEEQFESGFSGSVLSDEGRTVVLCSAVHMFLTEQKRSSNLSDHFSGYPKAVVPTRWVVMIGNDRYPVAVSQIDDGYKISFENQRFYITSRWILGRKLFECTINEKNYALQTQFIRGGIRINFMGSTVVVQVLTPRTAELYKYMKLHKNQENQSGEVIANLSGMVVEVRVKPGDTVSKGQYLMALEAMKMENAVLAPVDGVVKEVHVKKGDTVNAGSLLILIE